MTTRTNRTFLAPCVDPQDQHQSKRSCYVEQGARPEAESIRIGQASKSFNHREDSRQQHSGKDGFADRGSVDDNDGDGGGDGDDNSDDDDDNDEYVDTSQVDNVLLSYLARSWDSATICCEGLVGPGHERQRKPGGSRGEAG